MPAVSQQHGGLIISRLQLQRRLPLATPPAALNHGQERRPPSHGCRPKHRTYPMHPRAQVAAQAAATEVDVAVIGGGIIGLCVALELLSHASHVSVALIERQVPCSGATGAGQGYIWLAHRQPNSPGWAIAQRSKQLWESMIDAAETPSKNGHRSKKLGRKADIEWQENGSMLLALTAEEGQDLQDRAAMLQQNGITAAYHSRAAVTKLEPALQLPHSGGALLVESDAQLSGRRAAEVLLARCHEAAAPSGRFQAYMNEPVQSVQVSPQTGAVTAISTTSRQLVTRKGVIVAAGAWSGHLLSTATGDDRWREVFKPRRGHLLELQLPAGMPPLRHGLMEMGYTQHLHKSGPLEDTGTDIAFTATPSTSGTCLVGSAREFSGWDVNPSQSIQEGIMQRAAHFLPGLRNYGSASGGVRVGLRPYALGGLPFIGPVAEVPGLFLAAGHEGAGLTMAPGTAELIVQHLMQETTSLEQQHVDAFSPAQRMHAALAGMT
ncbi:hypothetical protein WJX77_006610 [Trebouxia sp. C0004]